MKPIQFIAVIAVLATTITACKGNGSSTTNDSTNDTVAKVHKDDKALKAPLDSTKTDTADRTTTDTLDARPVH